MPIEFTIILFILWTCFWSFSTVLIERWHSGKWGILFWRSECPKCHHELHWYELIPLFSWMLQWGKCKKCHSRIPTFYPISEIFFWILFILGWVAIDKIDTPLFSLVSLTLLFWVFVTGIYMVYDLKYMEIPDQIMIPGLWSVLVITIIWYAWNDWVFFFDSMTYHTYTDLIRDHIYWAALLYIFFALQIILPAWFFFLKEKKTKNIILLIGELIVFPLLLLLGKSHEKDTSEEEVPTWIWWGDLRVALFIGLSLGTIHGISTLFFAYIIWTLVSLVLLVKDAHGGKRLRHQVPFWPFLGLGWILSVVLHSEILMYVNSMSL